MDPSGFGGQTMAAPLRRALVATPDVAGWSRPEEAGRWQELGYRRPPDAAAAREQHLALCARLEEASVRIEHLAPGSGLTPDAVYTHDASLTTDRGMILLRPGKVARRDEPARHADRFREIGVPVRGAIREPGTAEGGDLVWLDPATLLAGRGYRTNPDGIEQLREMLEPDGVTVVEAALPHGEGPGACLHLMSLMSVLDDTTLLVDLSALAVPTVELLRGRGRRLLAIDPAERGTMACNVLALGDGRLLALEENPRTNRGLREAGFDVRTFPGSELAQNGGGGPTCLTRPLHRDDG
ncbi:MAG: arginine deiminase family protein [Acidobacteriota bacterium]|jgi:N-dimethylarginine dimethylaminohydrolase